MSQGISENQRIEILVSFIEILSREKGAVNFINQHKESLAQIIPHDVVEAVHRLTQTVQNLEDLKVGISKALNYLHNILSQFTPYPIKNKSFLHFLKMDNNQADKKLKKLRKDIIAINKQVTPKLREKIEIQVLDLQKFELHYTLKENLLFPFLEKSWNNYKCVHVMWSIQDDIRISFHNLIQLLAESTLNMPALNKEFGKLYTNLYAIIFREEKILFPVMLSTLSHQHIDELLIEAFDFGLPFVKFPESVIKTKIQHTKRFNSDSLEVHLPTGSLKLDMLEAIFNKLPVDITFVDENDTVVFYSNPPHRIFPRTNAVIGRLVQNCHPPESVHIVNKIVEEFKSGRKTSAEFWIQMKGRFIHISYYPIFSEDSTYRGVVEISQDATHLRSLTGEQRILDWE